MRNHKAVKTPIAKRAIDLVLDLLFPKYCLGCGLEGIWICESCKGKIVRIKSQVCPGCERLSLRGKYCSRCAKGRSLRGIVVTMYYEEGPAKELIHNLKYHRVSEIGQLLGKAMAAASFENLPSNKKWLVTAVPLHWFRFSQRGLNQAEVLAEEVARSLNLESDFKLIRKKRHTISQVGLRGSKRSVNLKGAFAVTSRKNIRGRNVIIVDDVSTTGTTLEECARVLKRAGARSIWGLVAARG